MVMSKSKVKQIEAKVIKLRSMYNSSKDELKRRIKKGSLSYVYYHILEDANFHTLNSNLEEIGAFKGSYGEAQEEYDEYRDAGGKTWDL